ncbi:MAG TPA: hypothetical protein VEN29_12410 [Casimicrobiaceae bacterium]|nr:hypothetical protein [Casimicrobiaceae bacterium]
MSYAAIEAIPPSIPTSTDRGVSKESAAVDQSYRNALSHVLSAINKQCELIEKKEAFEALLKEHLTAGWDGYDAQPVSADAVARAYEFAVALPPAYANADISVNRYGDVEFEWYVRPDKLFTLSIGVGGKYYYASLNGMERDSGFGYIAGLPLRILRGVSQVIGD